MLSIVIPLYNKEKEITRTLDSVFAQTYKDFEVIIVNNGSTDNSVQVLKNYFSSHNLPLIECNNKDIKTSTHQDLQDVKTSRHQDFKIRLINQSNSGVSAARNTGIESANFKYIALLDADDEWRPDYLQTQVNLIKKYPEASVFATNYQFKNEKGEITPTIIRKLPFEGEDGILCNYFQVASCSHPPLWTSAVVAKKSAFQAIGGFPEGLVLGEDLITWAKLACQYKIAFIKNSYAIYHFSSQEKRLIPQKKPDKIDFVGEELKNLNINYSVPFLKEYSARWHKIRMVTMVQLQMREQARLEYQKLKSYINPGKKEKLWYLLSFMPIVITRSFLKFKSKL